MRVAIVGGGVNGFCCAVQILEHFKGTAQATVISENFTPHTTGDGSAGLWGPFLLGATPAEHVHKWSKRMHDFLEQLWRSPDAGEAGVCLIPVVRLSTADTKLDDFWSDIVYGCRSLTPQQLDMYNVNRIKKFTSGLHFVTYTSEPTKLLPYLMKRFRALGGQIVQRKIEHFEQFVASAQYDVVVNCTGLGARQMLQDERTHAVRGQVARVQANWLYQVLLDESDDGNYIIPNAETVVLGGTHQEHSYNTTVSAQDKHFITHGCRQLVPGLEHALHMCDWVGLRPGRDTVRLELERTRNVPIVIHNYGHGGSGVTLAWGCATDVLQLLCAELRRHDHPVAKL